MRAANGSPHRRRAARDGGTVLAKDLGRDSWTAELRTPRVAGPVRPPVIGTGGGSGLAAVLAWRARVWRVVWWMPSASPGASVSAARRGCRMGRSRGDSRTCVAAGHGRGQLGQLGGEGAFPPVR